MTTIHAFHGSDGAAPNTTLLALDGTLYGTTSAGGDHGAGTVFRIREDGGGFESLHSFDYSLQDGSGPLGLAAGSDGNLYGTTSSGGASDLGTIYRLRPNGSFKTLFSFTSLNAGGWGPRGPLIQAGNGNFYGTTYSGGEPSMNCGGGCGTVFEIDGGDILVPEPGASSEAATAGLSLAFAKTLRRRRGRRR